MKRKQPSRKRLSQFKYFNSKLKSSRLLFFQETHLTIDCEIKWKDEFGGDLHFCHGSCISCRVLIALYGSQDIAVTKSCPTKREEYLFQIYGSMTLIFLLIDIYNAITEKEQVSVLKAIGNLFSCRKKRILILHVGNYNITPYKKICFILSIYFFFYLGISLFISL